MSVILRDLLNRVWIHEKLYKPWQGYYNIAALTPYGITAIVIDELKARTTAYNTALGQKESSAAERKGVRGSMNDLFDTVDEMLTEEF